MNADADLELLRESGRQIGGQAESIMRGSTDAADLHDRSMRAFERVCDPKALEIVSAERVHAVLVASQMMGIPVGLGMRTAWVDGFMLGAMFANKRNAEHMDIPDDLGPNQEGDAT